MKPTTKLIWISVLLLVSYLVIVNTALAQRERDVEIFLPTIFTGESPGVLPIVLDEWLDDVQVAINQQECFWVTPTDIRREALFGDNPIASVYGDVRMLLDNSYPHSRLSEMLVCPSEDNGFSRHVVSVILDTPDPAWTVSYYNGRNFNNKEPLVVSVLPDLYNLNWRDRSPVEAAGIGVDNFSIVFERTMAFTGDYYQIKARADDGIGVWLKAMDDTSRRGERVIDAWNSSAGKVTHEHNAILDGLYKVRVEYYEAGGDADLDFRIKQFQCCWNVSYFNNRSLAGSPVLVQREPIKSRQLDYNWGNARPVPALGEDEWSARWRGKFYFADDEYELWAEGDDGMRVFFDGKSIFNEWRDGGSKKYCKIISIDSGTYNIQVDYYENWGKAKLKFWWRPYVKASIRENLCTSSGTCVEASLEKCEDYERK